MKHKEYVRITKSADTAFLFIHGIMGSPNHFKDFVALLPDNVSVINMLLDGHGKTVKDFSCSSMEKWKTQVNEKVDFLLSSHKNIIIVGHSMGTLFAIEQAVLHPDRIKSLFLLSTPLKISVKPLKSIESIKVSLGMKCDMNNPKIIAAQNTNSIQSDKCIWRYFGVVPRFLELFREIKHTRDITSKISVPCNVFLSRHDEVVSMSSARFLKGNANTKIHILENSGHYYYPKNDKDYVLSEFKNLI